MLDTRAVYEDLQDVLSEAAARKLATLIGRVYADLYDTVTKAEFRELRGTVAELAEAQKRTEIKVGELAEAQKRTEARVGELAASQRELAEAQKRTEARVEELAEAQKRTEARVEELASSQEEGFRSLSDQIAALGGRWGIYSEGTFRSAIRALLAKVPGVEVREGYYGDRQVDVIVRDGEHVMLEITSRMHPKDIRKLYRSADDYREKEGVEPLLMVATSYVSPKLMQTLMGLERKIDIFSYEPDESDDWAEKLSPPEGEG